MADAVGRDESRGFLLLGVVCLTGAIVASSVLLAALQAAYSPFALQLPAAPFDHLETEAFRLAGASFLLAALWPRLVGSAPARGPMRVFAAGALSKLAVLAFAASQGMSAIQITDPRTLPPKLFTLRALANVVLGIAYVWVLVLAYRHHRKPRVASEPSKASEESVPVSSV